MILEGQHSGVTYDMTSYHGVAQYTLDAFEAACQIANEHCYEDIVDLSAETMIDTFCPDFVFADEDGELERDVLVAHVEVEIDKLKNRLAGKGG